MKTNPAGYSADALLHLAIDLANSLTAADRFERLLSQVRSIIPCDAVVLLQRQGDQLKPLAQKGLEQDVLGRRFDIASHPRFDVILQSTGPVRFAADSPLPDPYDGMVLDHQGDLPIHACMGLPLRSEGYAIGLLTLDSMTPGAFESIPARTLDIVATLAAAALKTAILLQKLERHSQHYQAVVNELTLEALHRDGGELVGDSQAMRHLRQEIALVAPSDFAVLIEGETGVGKELVARTLHRLSARADGPLVYVNCAAIPENLVESELFGHVKGAFTGADRRRAGKFSLADGGTLFLDEIGELPLAAQSKLLRALQNQEIQPLGQDRTEQVNVRVLAATNRVLKQEVESGHFREDLYHRLSVYPIRVPPLRERHGDITLLAGYFAEQTRRKLGLQQLVLAPAALERLEAYDWPGNVRELEHVISRAGLRARGVSAGRISRILESHLEHLSAAHSAPIALGRQGDDFNREPTLEDSQELGLKDATEQFQRQLIMARLEENAGNWSATARRLQLDRANLNRLAKRLGIGVKKMVLGQRQKDG